MTAATDTALTEAFDTIRTLTDQLAHARAEGLIGWALVVVFGQKGQGE